MAPMAWMIALMAALGSVMGSVGADSRPLTGSLDGSTIAVRTQEGTICNGSLVKTTRDGGLGSLDCADGRSGSFNWTITAPGEASADGWLSGEPLELTFHSN